MDTEGALLVEVEDVVEETAVLDVEASVYSVTPAQVRHTIEPSPVRHQTSEENQEVHHIVKEPNPQMVPTTHFP